MDANEGRKYGVADLAKDMQESVIFVVEGKEGEHHDSFLVPRSDFPRLPVVGEIIDVDYEDYRNEPKTPTSPALVRHRVADVKWFLRVRDEAGKNGRVVDIYVRVQRETRGEEW